MKALLVLLVCLCPCTPAWAQSADTPASLMVIGYGALAGADIAITAECLGRGVCREANPFLAPLAKHPGTMGAVKAGLGAALVATVYKVTKPRTQTRYAALAVLLAVQGAAVAVNVHTLRHHGR